MKKQEISDIVKNSEDKFSYQNIIIAFIVVCLLGLAAITSVFNNRIEKHDKELTFEICTLISEKLDSSMRYMSDSVKGCAAMLAGTPIKEQPDIMYDNFKRGNN